jgi:hypothetical protein
MRALDVIDSELRLLVAVRQTNRELYGRTPATTHVEPATRRTRGRGETVRSGDAL